jgi:hypothetical protein
VATPYDASYAVEVQRAYPDQFAIVKPVDPDGTNQEYPQALSVRRNPKTIGTEPSSVYFCPFYAGTPYGRRVIFWRQLRAWFRG